MQSKVAAHERSDHEVQYNTISHGKMKHFKIMVTVITVRIFTPVLINTDTGVCIYIHIY